MEKRQIEIDIDVYRFLEGRRTSFAQSQNDILRQLAGLDTSETIVDQQDTGRPWTGKGVTLPHRTKLRMSYNGKVHVGEIADGSWVVEGKVFNSPSAAAGGVARTKKGQPVSLDGWSYWEAQLPSSHHWKRIDQMRP
ncbi:MAG: hypothetical protein ACRCSO_03490 [Sphingomonas sp.]